MEQSFEVDLVYLWVNGNDPEWRRKHNAVIGNTREDCLENCEGRYADNEELRFSLRAVEMYAPWIIKIFIVTDNQVPGWLDVSNPRIEIVDHTEILPPEALPTFNSVVLEHALHKIPDLGERFLYSNDDMFFNRAVQPTDFFAPDGLPIVRMVRRPLPKLGIWARRHILGRVPDNYNLTIQRASRLVESRYGKYIGHKPHHNIDAYLKSDYIHTFETFRQELEPTLRNHVRSDNDIQRVIYSYVPLAEKRAHAVFVDQHTSFRLHTHRLHHYDRLRRYNPMLCCLNDSQYATDAHRLRVREYMEERFSQPSSFEKV